MRKGPVITELHAWLHQATRAKLARVWKVYKAGQRLKGKERLLECCMAAHPEWTTSWERVDQVRDDEAITPEGVDPSLRIHGEAAVQGIIGKGGGGVLP